MAFDGSSDDVFAEMIEAVRSGAVDAMVDDEPAFGAQLASGDYRIAHVAATQNPWGAACRLGDRQMVALLDDGLGRAIASGALADEWRAGSATRPCRRRSRRAGPYASHLARFRDDANRPGRDPRGLPRPGGLTATEQFGVRPGCAQRAAPSGYRHRLVRRRRGPSGRTVRPVTRCTANSVR